MSPLSLPDDVQSNFAALVHEFRQPLSNIEACTSLLRIILEQSEDARVEECLDRIDRQVEAIDRMLEAARRPDQPSSRALTNAESAAVT
jgi:nitrogen-specific signal transduction histidine kinase